MKQSLQRAHKSCLNPRQTQRAIKIIKDTFQTNLADLLNLERVSAPLFVRSNSGLNDDLNGVERPVSFSVKDIYDDKLEIVHSLAKWKRMALHRYGFKVGEGLYTDMTQSDAMRIWITSTLYMLINGTGKNVYPKRTEI